MKLTKEQALHEHRKMWRWLAEFYASIDRWNGYVLSIVKAKALYLNLKGYEEIEAHCFCCEYARLMGIECEDCPIVWHDESGNICDFYGNITDCMDGEFGAIRHSNDAKEISKMCRIIEELPERKNI